MIEDAPGNAVEPADTDPPRQSLVPAEFRKVHEICTAREGQIGGNPCLVVDARELHAGLGVKTKFADWIKDRVLSSGEFRAGLDYSENSEKSPSKLSGRPSKEVILTLAAAKKVAMAEGGPVGALVRDYFLWCEKVMLGAAANPAVSNDMTIILHAMAESSKAADRRYEAMMMATERHHETIERIPLSTRRHTGEAVRLEHWCGLYRHHDATVVIGRV
jgi:phage anti-repressor protein